METALVALAGLALAMIANAVSPRGLDLSRNYFPSGTNSVASAPAPAPPPAPAAETNAQTADELVSEQIKAKGLQPIDRAAVLELFHDPRFQYGAIVFIDARNEDAYRLGHIPGAYEYDPYHPEKQLAKVVAACQTAEKIVVYCTGGDCEDSQFAAINLRDAGVPNDKLFVFGGGITEWSANQLPMETGERNSGNVEHANP